MTDSLTIFGTTYTGVTGIIATDTNSTDKTYIRPQGTKSISANGTGIDVAAYASVDVNVPGGGSSINNQDKTVTPTESQQSISADSGYTGLGTVTVNAISSTYVGSGITRRSSTDLTASGATVTVPAGYYSAQASKAVSSGSATGPTSLSASSATVIAGTNTLTLTKSGVSTTPTVSAGYISSATSSSATVTLMASVTTKEAATITPTKSSQTIAANTYLKGVQTIAAIPAQYITTTDATASSSDILSGETAYVNGSKVTGNLVVQHYYTGSSAPSSSLGSNGDIYIQA